MKSFQTRSHSISGAFVFLLLGIFALFSVLMVLLSAQLYRNTVHAGDEHNALRVASSYLMNTVHAADRRNAISVEEREGIPMLVLSWPDEDGSEDPGDMYETLIYCSGGSLYELLISGGSEFVPDDGEVICSMADFRPSLSGQTLTLDYTDGAGSHQLSVHLFSGKEVAQ